MVSLRRILMSRCFQNEKSLSTEARRVLAQGPCFTKNTKSPTHTNHTNSIFFWKICDLLLSWASRCPFSPTQSYLGWEQIFSPALHIYSLAAIKNWVWMSWNHEGAVRHHSRRRGEQHFLEKRSSFQSISLRWQKFSRFLYNSSAHYPFPCLSYCSDGWFRSYLMNWYRI